MFSIRAGQTRKSDEGERPFWISYADLMTALMILFLVVMVASIASVTQRISAETDGEKSRTREIADLCARLQLRARDVNKHIQVDCKDNRVNFGEAGRFGYNAYRLPPTGRDALQDLVPLVLEAADSKEGLKWMKQVLIEGFTDTDGSYLYNLHLSLQRSEYVMCALLDTKLATQARLSDEQKSRVRELFLAGGVSFNNAKESKEASRRVELRLQFYGLKDKQTPSQSFQITSPEVCQLR